MSEKSSAPDRDLLQSQAHAHQPDGADSTPDEADKVGPGHPPRAKRWQKGGPSPNPKGRPRKDQSLLPDVRKAFEQAINKKVSVPRGDRKVLMTRLEIGFEQLLNQFAKGDRYARRDIMELADKLGIDFLAQHKGALEAVLTPNHQAILDAYVARRTGADSVASAARVLAPPQLLDDDDSTEAEPTAAEPASPPKPEAKPKIPMPTPIPGKQYPKPPERMTRLELAAWYPEWFVQNGEAWEKERLGR